MANDRQLLVKLKSSLIEYQEMVIPDKQQLLIQMVKILKCLKYPIKGRLMSHQFLYDLHQAKIFKDRLKVHLLDSKLQVNQLKLAMMQQCKGLKLQDKQVQH